MRSNFLRAGLLGRAADETKAPYKIEPGQAIVQDQPPVETPRPGWVARQLDSTLDGIVRAFTPLY